MPASPATQAYEAASASAGFTITKENVASAYTGATTADYHDSFIASARLTDADSAAPLPGKSISFELGNGDTCTAVTDAAGSASCPITPTQPAGDYPITARFAGDTDYLAGLRLRVSRSPASRRRWLTTARRRWPGFYLAAGTTSTLNLQYYTGRSFGTSRSVLGSPPAVAADTGPIRTAARSESRAASVVAQIPLATATGLDSSVVTSTGKSTATAKLSNITIGGLLGLLAVRVTGVSAASESTCSGTSGSTTIGSLQVGLLNVNVGNPAPNTRINVLGLSILLNEQKPVPGADHGLEVNALHITFPGGIDYVVSSATSDIHHCA